MMSSYRSFISFNPPPTLLVVVIWMSLCAKFSLPLGQHDCLTATRRCWKTPMNNLIFSTARCITIDINIVNVWKDNDIRLKDILEYTHDWALLSMTRKNDAHNAQDKVYAKKY